MRLNCAILAVLAAILAASQQSCSRKAIVVKHGHVSAFKQPIDLDKAQSEWQAIRNGDGGAIPNYNKTVQNVISQISYQSIRKNEETGPLTLKTTRGDFPLIIDTIGIETPSHVDRVLPIESLHVKRGFRQNTRVDGVGAPLVVRQKWTPSDSMIAETGLWYPVTAIFDLDVPDRPVLRFLDPTRNSNSTVAVGASQFPLQADYTAALARDLYDRQSQFVNLSGLIKYEKFSKHMGLFRISAFDPDKIPIIFIHGINSTPNTWNNPMNELLADPVVRDTYEFWTFGYPTGAPLPFLSARLRVEVEKMIAYRNSRGAQTERITILAHSMGGLLSKPLTQSSGTQLWSQVFNVPPEELNVSRANQELLARMFIFEPIPQIDRMIFLAVPHKGSPLAGPKTAMIAEWIIQAPSHLLTLSKLLISDSHHQLTQVGREVVGRVPTSVQQLSEQSAAIELFSPIPLNPRVKYHSIIGNESGSDKVANIESSDGVVEYKSSHLEGATSELVVKGDHTIHRFPPAVAEIARILVLNANEPGPGPRTPQAAAQLVFADR